MPLDEPKWWYGPADARVVRLLQPLAQIYGRLAARRLGSRQGYRSRLPVICVGNFTAGGTGKTPLTLEVVRRLVAMGERPAILTRGYGGRIAGPHWIDLDRDTARTVGDEPLLLARAAPTLVARDRRAGAIAIETTAQGYTAIVMDDGLQNPALNKDLTFAVIDARRGLGNGQVIPAGPLRAPMEVQLPLADAIVVNAPPTLRSGEADDTVTTLRRAFPGPVLAARVTATGDLDWLREGPVLAFAGIANPERFFSLVRSCGGQIAETRVFKDHHAFSAAEIADLIARAQALGCALATTEKDLVRLTHGTAEARQLARQVRAVAIRATFDDADDQRADALIAGAVGTGGYRGGAGRR